ncbi:MAG: branched-chain amino acid ABC transporter substrate-binding protein [Candidatus Omnitrophica bacterium]|nr:branched-chain amino acid ABC transporter substrate-binding protein [Candidatus Omnitrophota bacterium]
MKLAHSTQHTAHSRGWKTLFAVCCLLSATSCGPRERVVKIGFVVPLTGDQAPHGEDMLNGAMLAIEHASAQGPVLPGYRLALYPLDDQRNPTQAVTAAKKLVADPAVVAVVGHLNSSCTMPASAIYHQARLLQVSPVSSNPQISRQGFDTFYRTCTTDDLQGPAAARFVVKELGAKRVFILDDMTTYGRGLANEFEAALHRLQAEVVGHEGITQGDKDFAPLLTKIKSFGPDLLYFAGMFPEASLLIKQRKAVGLAAAFMGSDGMFEPALIGLATPQAAEGVYLTTIGSDIHQIPTAQAFLKEYEQRFGSIGAYSAYAYEAASIAAWAIRKAGVPDREAVLAAIKQLKDYPGLFGLQNFDEKGDSRIRDVGVFTVKDGRFQFVKTASLN